MLVIDRGGDAMSLLSDWLDQDYRFVVRLRGDGGNDARRLRREDPDMTGLAKKNLSLTCFRKRPEDSSPNISCFRLALAR